MKKTILVMGSLLMCSVVAVKAQQSSVFVKGALILPMLLLIKMAT